MVILFLIRSGLAEQERWKIQMQDINKSVFLLQHRGLSPHSTNFPFLPSWAKNFDSFLIPRWFPAVKFGWVMWISPLMWRYQHMIKQNQRFPFNFLFIFTFPAIERNLWTTKTYNFHLFSENKAAERGFKMFVYLFPLQKSQVQRRFTQISESDFPLSTFWIVFKLQTSALMMCRWVGGFSYFCIYIILFAQFYLMFQTE